MLKFYLFFITNLSLSQSHFIFDSETKKPVPFTNILYLKEESIIDRDYCNEIGLFTIKTNISFDKITFSCVGYETKSVDNFSNIDIIYLIKKSILLDEVIISKNKNTNFSILGFSKSKKKTRLSAYKGFEIVVFIDNPFNQPKDVQSFLFKVKNDQKFKTAVRVHFYKKDLEKLIPSEEILNEDIIKFIEGGTKELIEVDVSKYELELPIEGAFIGIEWLGAIDEKSGEFITDKTIWSATYIEVNDKINQPLTFIRSKFNNHKWENTENMKVEVKKYIEYKNYPNASFGIKIFN